MKIGTGNTIGRIQNKPGFWESFIPEPVDNVFIDPATGESIIDPESGLNIIDPEL